MQPFNRRTFIKSSAIIAASAALPARSWGQIMGSNADLRVGVIGLNGRGKSHLQSLSKIQGVRVVAICDPDSSLLDKAKPSINGGDVKTYTDMRDMFNSPDVDAVTVATPNHWHALAAVWAMQAGKDVYLEKPVSHTVWEGRQVVAAAKKYNRVVQAGTQIRSGEGLREAVAYVQAGNLGKIVASRGFCYKRRDSIGQCGGPQPIPANINYDLWSGPAQLVAPHRNFPRNGPVHYDWHWFYLYGNGDVGNQGIHQMDVARWFLGEPGLPDSTLSIGGRLGYIDDAETPNTQTVIHHYAKAPLIFEVRGLPKKAGIASMGGDPAANQGGGGSGMDNYRGVDIGNVIECEGGSMIVPSYTTARAVDKDGKVMKEFKGGDRHMQNFIDVVRSRKTADLYGPIEEGHISSALCHLGQMSHQLGRTESPEKMMEMVKSDSMMSEAAGRMMEHVKANNVDFSKTPLTMGMPLLVDAKAERLKGPNAAKANAMLKKEYRKPYVLNQVG